jgi:hypothetical protein
LDTPSGEVEVSSSYDLSIFSPKTDAQFSKGGGNAPKGSSSVSIEELWAEMDMMDAISHGGTSAGNVPRNAHRKRRSVPLVETTGECTSCTDKGALWMILLDHRMPCHEVVKEVTGNIPRKNKVA